MWTMSSSYPLTVLLILHGTSLASSSDEVILDASVGAPAVLQCQYTPSLTTSSSKLFWIRTNRQHTNDIVAIGETLFSQGYSVKHAPSEGKYDLKIEKAEYDRDNGKFSCQMKQGGTGTKLHSSAVRLVVLIPPEAPSIQPANTTFTEGDEANFTCSSRGGSPPPQIDWYTLGDNPSKLDSGYVRRSTEGEVTTAILSIVPKKEDDGSQYRCHVWNRAMKKNDILSAVTSINVNYFPRVTIRPENTVRVERGDAAELFCKVDAKPAVDTVTWIREGRVVAQTLKHVIPRVSSMDAGQYSCQADNHLGQVGSAEARLDVQHGPRVHLPVRKEAGEGEEVVAFCNVTANPRASSIVWSKEGDEHFVESGPTLRLPGTNAATVTMGRYTCTAANVVHPTGGEKRTRKANATIEVLVKHAPGKAVIAPVNPVGVEGEEVRLECGADPPGHPEPTYTWWREGRKSVVLSKFKEMIIRSSSLNDRGKYFCQPTNVFGEGTEAETILEIYQKPKIVLPLENEVKKTGDTSFSLTCAALAKPKPHVTWFKDGEEIDASTSNLYQISGSQQLMYNETTSRFFSILKFLGPNRKSTEQLVQSDRGNYSCQFKNEVGVINTRMMLRIEHAPIVKHIFNKVAADRGESASIKCRVQAYPSPQISWSKKNSNLGKYNVNENDIGDDTYESVLHIGRVNWSSYGQYKCRTTNKMGSQFDVIKLQAKGKPDMPSNIAVSEKSPYSVSLNWVEGFDGGYQDTTFNVEYKSVEGRSLRHLDCGRSKPCVVSGLDQFTTYQFRVQSVNIRGSSEWTRTISVTTRVDVSQIPQPKEVQFATMSKMAAFKADQYELPLIAEMEFKNHENAEVVHKKVSVEAVGNPYKQVSLDELVSELRVRFCLANNSNLCGAYVVAKTVERLSLEVNTLEQHGMIALLVFAGLLTTAFLCCVVLMCCRGSKKNKFAKNPISDPIILPSHSYDFVDSKDMNTAGKMQDSPVMTKSQFGYSQPPLLSESDQFSFDSYTNSSTLPKHSSTNSSTLPKHIQVDPYHGYSQGGQYFGKLQAPQQFQYGYDDYPSQYPHLAAEYTNGQQRARLVNGDRYALPNKPRQRQGVDFNFYGDDTGVPDHYSVQNISEGLGSSQEVSSHAGESIHSNAGMSVHSNAGISMSSNQGVSLHNGSSFLDGVPLPEGYSSVHSTPSRKVYREVIV